MNETSQLSRGGAWVMGVVFALCGVPPLLIALHIIPRNPAPDSPPTWVVICLGGMFVAAGMAIIVDYGLANPMNASGEFAPGTPWSIRAFNLLLGSIIIGSRTAIFGWVGFGRGPRHFSTTISLPFLNGAISGRANELSGRIVFGGGSILMAGMFLACLVVGIRRLRAGQ